MVGEVEVEEEVVMMCGWLGVLVCGWMLEGGRCRTEVMLGELFLWRRRGMPW